MATHQRCDGCQLGPGEYECDDEDGELCVCPDCGYAVCDDCHCHACTFSSCGRRCAGRGMCTCGSCQSEIKRLIAPTRPEIWNYVQLPPLDPPLTAFNEDMKSYIQNISSVSREGISHHHLARGSCRCEHSNFGIPYADMCASYGGKIPCYMGGRGGSAFKGPVKPQSQKEMEDMIMRRDLPSIPVEERKCYNPTCNADADLRCSQCRSVWYCSKACQAAHYRDGRDEAHKKQCGKYYPPSEWRVASIEAKEYKEKHGHYPGEVVWDCSVPRLTNLAMSSLKKSDHPLVNGRNGVTADDIVAELSIMGGIPTVKTDEK